MAEPLSQETLGDQQRYEEKPCDDAVRAGPELVRLVAHLRLAVLQGPPKIGPRTPVAVAVARFGRIGRATGIEATGTADPV